MKDLIQQILKYLPEYFSEFGEVFAGPKTFIHARNMNADDAFANALLFLGVSIALVIIMTTPLQPPGKDFWTFVAAVAVLTLVSVAIFGTIIRISWWLVGGRANAQCFFITYSYFFGVIFVIFSVVQLIGTGTLKFFDPSLYSQILEARAKGQAPNIEINSFRENLLIAYFSILGAGFVLTSIWGFISWGAYRQLNSLGRGHSFAALMIAGIIEIPVLAITMMISSALAI